MWPCGPWVMGEAPSMVARSFGGCVRPAVVGWPSKWDGTRFVGALVGVVGASVGLVPDFGDDD